MKRENASNFKIPLPNSRSSQQRPPLSQDEVRQVDHADPQHPSQPSSSNAAERNRQTWTQRISSLVPRPFALNTTSSVPETTESSSNSKARASRIDNSGTSLTRKVSRSGKPSWRTRKHLASSILASIPAFSNPRVYTYDNDLYRSGEPLDPLLTAQYDEPQIIKAFADALTGEDLGLNAEEEEAEEINRQPLTEGQQEGAESDLDLEKEQRTAWKDEVPGADAMPSNSLLSGGDDPDPSKSTTKHAPPRHLGEDSIVRRGEHTNGNAPTTPMRARSKSINKKDLFLSSASDFAPIRERRQPTRSKGGRNVNKLRGSDTGTREGLVYKLIRFPLLFAIFFTIALEFLLYVIIRQAVNLVEYAIAWKGKKGELRKELRKANSWKEWRRWAVEMDEYVGYGRWKEKDASGLYDWILVRKVVKSLRQFRERDDAEKVLGVLNLCVRNNFAGVEGFRLYSETFFGTKNLIERYVDEVEESLDYIRKTDKIDLEAKRGFYRTVKKNFGTSALCLSGGASFGYCELPSILRRWAEKLTVTSPRFRSLWRRARVARRRVATQVHLWHLSRWTDRSTCLHSPRTRAQETHCAGARRSNHSVRRVDRHVGPTCDADRRTLRRQILCTEGTVLHDGQLDFHGGVQAHRQGSEHQLHSSGSTLAGEAAQLRHQPGLRHLERVARLCSRSRYSEPDLPDGQDSQWASSAVELGTPLQGWIPAHGHTAARVAIALQRQLSHRLAMQSACASLLFCTAGRTGSPRCTSERQRLARRIHPLCRGARAEAAPEHELQGHARPRLDAQDSWTGLELDVLTGFQWRSDHLAQDACVGLGAAPAGPRSRRIEAHASSWQVGHFPEIGESSRVSAPRAGY